MKCTKCRKDLILPLNAYRNLETYNVGGSVMAASECCNTGYVIKMNISYKVTEYTGPKTEDDWGIKLKKINNVKIDPNKVIKSKPRMIREDFKKSKQ